MSQTSNDHNDTEEISGRDIIDHINSLIKYLKSKWIIIASVGILGCILGLCYAVIKKPLYTATCTFVLEETKSSGLGQYAGLASLAGITTNNGGGIFEGDNILVLYTSRTMIEQALLTSCNFNGKNELLIDRFIDSYKLHDPKKGDDQVNINFNGDPNKFSRAQDSVVTNLTDFFNQKILAVTKPDKKLSIINVAVTSTDELFSKYFNEKLVETVNNFYVQTKTKKAYQSVKLLQHQADSVRAILNSSIYGVASAIESAPNANPDLSTLRTTSQKRQVDVQANSAIYGEMVKNLEVQKMSLSQETPLIQIIDKPVLPLFVQRATKIKSMFIGACLFAILSMVYLSIRKFLSHYS